LAREAIRKKIMKEKEKRRKRRMSSKDKIHSQPVCYNIRMLSNDNLSLVATMVSGSSVPGVGHLHSVH
jgi:hypothetical protein